MLLIDGFVHRSALSEILTRWMVDRPAPGDVMRLKTIINFNSYIARLWIDWFARDVLHAFHGIDPTRYSVRLKGQLKDFIVAHPQYVNPRVEEMLERYRRFPEDYYRDTPIDGAIYVNGADDSARFVGSSRIKRIRRIAEKGSRRIIDFMLGRIRANADVLAEERARSLGISKDQLITPQEMMVEEFNHAERRLLKSIKQGTIQSELPELEIPDVAGVKVIVEPDAFGGFRDLLAATPGVEIAEEEHHVGHYNGINLKLAFALPKARLLAAPPDDSFLRVLSFRGFDRDTVAEEYRAFVESAEDTVRLEMIVASFEELLESEIGRSMHEERVRVQRGLQDYNGHLATNVRYFMDFVLSLCRAPACADLAEVPIKLWVKYMPDAHERAVRNLYVPEEFFFDTAGTPSCPPPECRLERREE
ncbi:MAG: hypothetical protein M0R80_16310 [Proteobacteria bacterium]|jgi:hypothetical protein|nr:hypothetical protein [Pseudomonadota bacterium]